MGNQEVSQKTDTDSSPYYIHWQTPQFYRTYYRRLVLFSLLLTLVLFALLGVAFYNFYTLYVQAKTPYYVFTTEGELISLTPHFDKTPLLNQTGAQ